MNINYINWKTTANQNCYPFLSGWFRDRKNNALTIQDSYYFRCHASKKFPVEVRCYTFDDSTTEIFQFITQTPYIKGYQMYLRIDHS